MSAARVVRRASLLTVLAAAPIALVATAAHADAPTSADHGGAAPLALARTADPLLQADTATDGQRVGVQRRVTAAQRASLATSRSQTLGSFFAQASSSTCAITGIVWDDANQNGLKTTGETPIAGTTVVLRWDSTTVLASQTTGADGLYKFDDLQCGSYDVGFTLPSGYSWTKPLVADGKDDSKATDPGSGFLDGITPSFTVGPDQLGTRRSTAADAVQASYIRTDIDAGMFRTGATVAASSAAASQAPVQAPGASATAAQQQADAATTKAAATQAAAAKAAATKAAATKAAAAKAAAAKAGQAAAAGDLAYTGTAAETIGWTGAGLLAAGVVMVAATSSRGPRHARQRA